MRSRLRFAAAAALATTFAAGSALAENRTTVEVTAVLASYQGRSFDRRLSHLKNELRGLPFRSYRYLGSETRELHGNGEELGIELPHGRYLYLGTREHTPAHLKLHILLNEDNRPVVNTYVKLELGSVVLLGGPRDNEGTLFIAIGSNPGGTPTGDNTPDEKRKNEWYTIPRRESGSASGAAPNVAPGAPTGAASSPPQSGYESSGSGSPSSADGHTPAPSEPSSVIPAGLRPIGEPSFPAPSSLVPASPGR